MPTIGHNAKLYQERREPYLRSTLRGPGPNVYLPDNLALHFKLEAPLPLPTLIHDKCAPDNARTQVWPHGDTTAP